MSSYERFVSYDRPIRNRKLTKIYFWPQIQWCRKYLRRLTIVTMITFLMPIAPILVPLVCPFAPSGAVGRVRSSQCSTELRNSTAAASTIVPRGIAPRTDPSMASPSSPSRAPSPPLRLCGKFLCAPPEAVSSCKYSYEAAILYRAAALGHALDDTLHRLTELLGHLSALARARQHAAAVSSMLYCELATTAAADAGAEARGTVGALVKAAGELRGDVKECVRDSRAVEKWIGAEKEVLEMKERMVFKIACFVELDKRLKDVCDGCSGPVSALVDGDRTWPDVPESLASADDN